MTEEILRECEIMPELMCLYEEYDCIYCGGIGQILINEWDDWEDAEECEYCQGDGIMYMRKIKDEDS